MAQLNKAASKPPDPVVAKGTLVNSRLMGCDPEFVMAQGAVMKSPWSPFVLPTMRPDGSSDWDDYTRRRFGSDGSLFELRPKPEKSTYKLTANLRSLIVNALPFLKPEAKKYGWYGNPNWGRTHCVGGHIHIGGDFDSKQQTALMTLSSVIECSSLLSEELSKRRRDRYSSDGLTTRTDHKGHWEFRYLGTWLFHPRVAFCVLTLAKLAVEDPKYIEGCISKGNPWGSLVLLARTFADRDSDASRCATLLDMGPDKICADPTRSFVKRWLDWSPK